MSEVLEISSDSSDTIIVGPNENLPENEDNSEIENLLKKYLGEKYDKPFHEDPEDKLKYNANFDDTDLGISPIKKTKHGNLLTKSHSESSNSDDTGILKLLSEKYTKTKTNGITDKENKKQEKELQKQQKAEERERKKREVECEKALRQALSTANKNLKPTECMKFILVKIDNHLLSEDYGNDVISALQNLDVKYEMQTQLFQRTITWTRTTQSHLLNDNGKLTLSSEDQETDHILMVMNCKEFVEHVDNSTLAAHIGSIKSVLAKEKKITLAIYGLKNYTRYQKNKQYNEIRTQITDENERQTTNNVVFHSFPKVSQAQIEYALTELQLVCNCSHRFIETAPDLAQMVTQFTKAVAEIPFKLQRQEKFKETECFIAGDNRDCVKVDKDGNGLGRLWNQALTLFPMARLETAEAISVKYPNVSSLMKAYDECQSTKEGEMLLQDIPVRRAAGPLSATRKIGPEMSKKIYNFFTSLDGEALL